MSVLKSVPPEPTHMDSTARVVLLGGGTQPERDNHAREQARTG